MQLDANLPLNTKDGAHLQEQPPQTEKAMQLDVNPPMTSLQPTTDGLSLPAEGHNMPQNPQPPYAPQPANPKPNTNGVPVPAEGCNSMNTQLHQIPQGTNSQPNTHGIMPPAEGRNPPPSSQQLQIPQVTVSQQNANGVISPVESHNPPPSAQPHPMPVTGSQPNTHGITPPADGHIPPPSAQSHQILQVMDSQPNANGVISPVESHNDPLNAQPQQMALVTTSQPSTNEIQSPAGGQGPSRQGPSRNPPAFKWPLFQPLIFESNPFLLQSKHTNTASDRSAPGQMPDSVLGRRFRDTPPPASNPKRRRARSAELQPSLKEPAPTPINISEILTMLEVRDKRNREDLLDEFRRLMAQKSNDRSLTASAPGPSSQKFNRQSSITSSSAPGPTAAVTLTEEKILELITPLLLSGQYVFNYAFLSIADLCKDTSQPNQLAAGTEDIEMDAPPASAPEIAATIFAEMQKHMLNGKHVNCTP